MSWIGIDVGGTFTDAVVYDAKTGGLRMAKAATTPAAPKEGVLHALEKLDIRLEQVERFVHGLTLGTNAILERKGAPVWMLTTRGFRDTMEIARTNRPVLYNIKTLKEDPIVARPQVIEINERILYDGAVRGELDDQSVREAIEALRKANATTVAVCFLHSYVNPAHEQAVAERVRKAMPGCFVCTSSEVLSEFREYERFSTTALNAYIGPKISHYLGSLCSALQERGHQGEVFIMTSGGGVVPAPYAGRFPVNTVLSGPAGGVAAAVHLGRMLGRPNLITYDMGGTSTDVCLIENLQIPVTSEQFISGLPNRKSQIEINSVGAGGGSIAWVDSGPFLRVGPQSAAASPGPACYGKGGVEATVTDADVLLHRIAPHGNLSGEVRIDLNLARTAIRRLQKHFPALEEHALADGIIKIAVAKMVSAIKEISVSKGHDPRDFTLLAYGGAGPLHAVLIAEELEMTSVLIPPGPGNFSALGAILSDLRHDYVRTRLLNTRTTPFAEVKNILQDLAREGRAELAAEGVPAESVEIRYGLGMRYLGQSWELAVEVPHDVGSADDIEQIFYEAHKRRYGHCTPDATEIVSFRVAAIGTTSKPQLPTPPSRGELQAALGKPREVYSDGSFIPSPVYLRERLHIGASFSGPALVEEGGSVTWIPHGWNCSVIELGALLVKKEQQ